MKPKTAFEPVSMKSDQNKPHLLARCWPKTVFLKLEAITTVADALTQTETVTEWLCTSMSYRWPRWECVFYNAVGVSSVLSNAMGSVSQSHEPSGNGKQPMSALRVKPHQASQLLLFNDLTHIHRLS